MKCQSSRLSAAWVMSWAANQNRLIAPNISRTRRTPAGKRRRGIARASVPASRLAMPPSASVSDVAPWQRNQIAVSKVIRPPTATQPSPCPSVSWQSAASVAAKAPAARTVAASSGSDRVTPGSTA